MSIVIGDFSVPLTCGTVQVECTRLVPGTRVEERKTVKKALETHYQEITLGCSDRCAGLGAYTKTSLKRAIKEQDLNTFGKCFHCGLSAQIGEGRKRREQVPISVMVDVESVELVTVPCMVEEKYYKEVQNFQQAALIEKPKLTVAPNLMAQSAKAPVIAVFKEKQIAPEREDSENSDAKALRHLDEVYAQRIKAQEGLDRVVARHLRHREEVRAVVEEEEDATFRMFESFFNKTFRTDRYEGKIITVRNGVMGWFTPNRRDIKNAARRRKRANKKALFEATERIITSISTKDDVQENEEEETSSPTIRSADHSLKKRVKKKKVTKPILASREQVNQLVMAVTNICKKNSTKLQIVGGRRQLDICCDASGKSKVDLLHLRGILKRRDCSWNNHIAEFTNMVLPKLVNKNLRHISQISHGCSGFILDCHKFKGGTGRTFGQYLIIRGNADGRIIDARSKLTHSIMINMDHYSDAGSQFWRGFDRQFIDTRDKPQNLHECRATIKVEECGEMAAIINQLLFPMWKITCSQCGESLEMLSQEEELKSFKQKRSQLASKLSSFHAKFPYINNFLNRYENSLDRMNTNFDAHKQIAQLIGGRKEVPFSNLERLNELLIKSEKLTSKDFVEMSQCLLELTRWHKNRSDSFKKGEIHHFRNKVSGKAHFNFALMCDNQLDKNGNFEWGERGYHAKRFFSNFFEKVDPTDGYKKHITRNNPNGTRQTAIGKLILSTDPSMLRQQMKGNPITRVPVGKYCTSKKEDCYVYPACCVTMEDGTPMYSDIKMPTKNHLVIGNSGDPKYVDVPSSSSDMVVAKEGYCYLNIFLAMLLNVNESESKSFTKKVRDIVVPRLGQWPSLIDVATECYFLSAFHPETKNAELPRILVDHTSKCMHVIDSYGSLDTQFHVLKANTVSQFIKFADDDLDSEMKHYLVGGDSNQLQSHLSSMKLLCQSIYRPNLMKQCIEEEPFLLVLSCISPGVLISLYNSHHLETALRYWMSKQQSIASLLAMVHGLAAKVSVAHTLNDQMRILERGSQELVTIMESVNSLCHSYSPTLQHLMVISNRRETNASLDLAGFSLLTPDTGIYWMEKNYLEMLEQSWSELKWWERLSEIWRSSKHSHFGIKQLSMKGATDLGGRYSISAKQYLTLMTRPVKISCVKARDTCSQIVSGATSWTFKTTFAMCKKVMPDCLKFINMLVVISLLLNIWHSTNGISLDYAQMKREKQMDIDRIMTNNLISVHKEQVKANPDLTKEEFREYIRKNRPELIAAVNRELQEEVDHQAKRNSEQNLEKIIAFVALVLMIFDSEKSDCVYKTLNKLRNLVSTCDEPVAHQSLDDIQEILTEKATTIDFELDTESNRIADFKEMNFASWWDKQIQFDRVIPHYRTTGKFIEFTRDSCSSVANTISHSPEKEWIVRGGVGSGKSTGLPFALSGKGSVLMLEPTRPLAENVSRQIRQHPFYLNPTLRMRGLSSFGSSNVSIMTSGFAFNYFANNALKLKDFDFILIDECHVLDSNAMAFDCLLKEHNYEGKVLKVSATPQGRECEFHTQFPVTMHIEEQLSFQAFCEAQGTGSERDAIQHGDNILVYVASYNEVDLLSKMLNEKHYLVTKVDGRTMKVGSTDIVTKGSSQKKHFIVATNIIENGVTLDVDVVVDFGLKVVAEMDYDNRCVTYTKTSISYGERIQRLGRVGRHKKGHAIRIGSTIKGLIEIPSIIATQAAFQCFVYGLPVMTQGVSVNMLSNCTVRQARTMSRFELPPYFMAPLVYHDGSMHPEIHKHLIPYKLDESEIQLSQLAFSFNTTSTWFDNRFYDSIGIRLDISREAKIPFHCKEFPDTKYQAMWDDILKIKNTTCFNRMNLVSATKVAYTLKTDIHAIGTTLHYIDALLQEEYRKQNHFRAMTSNACSGNTFSMLSIANAIRNHYAKDYTTGNIHKLQAAKNQILEFKNLGADPSSQHLIQEFGALELVTHQSSSGISQYLGLKGKWNKSLITRDILILLGVTIGGFWMLWDKFKSNIEGVQHEGKRKTQKLKFRDARDAKMGREIYGDDGTIEHFFGSAYTKRGAVKGEKRGMGSKTRRFVSMYGVNLEDFAFIRYIDPLTGATRDESPLTDVELVQAHFGEIRDKLLDEGKLERQSVITKPGLTAYLVKDGVKSLMRVDLEPHNPLLICKNKSTIAGFPEKEFTLRQHGQAYTVDRTELPERNEDVSFEGATSVKGLRDYNGISSAICQLSNSSNGRSTTTYGIGYGSYIIVNRHLFKENNGSLLVKSMHGIFNIKNSKQIKIVGVSNRDIAILQMPKDFPPFAQRLRFRNPVVGESICLLGNTFQDKYNACTVSESCKTFPRVEGSFWKHWISTTEGHCGLPLVSVTDGFIVGIHSLMSHKYDHNYYSNFDDNFEADYIHKLMDLKWEQNWTYNINTVSWGNMKLQDSAPSKEFKTTKLISDLCMEPVCAQSKTHTRWLYNQLEGNLKAVGFLQNNFVTKHIVKGPCKLFELYLQTHEDANEYFRPFMGFYGKSGLNKEAYVKDLFKYSSEIPVGEVDTDKFEEAIQEVITIMMEHDFRECRYITDCDAIFDSLNMKAAVGALYSGKKKTYFEGSTYDERNHLLQLSCLRLFKGDLGIWNGSLKAELRPIEKVEANKTRTFTAAPIETLLGGKACVDDFNNQFYDLNMKCPWTVGMTKFYGGWNELLGKLPDGWIYCDADGSRFDSSLTPYLLNAVLGIREFFMEDWEIGLQMLRNLYTEIIYTPIATPDGTIVKKFRGNNSGQPSTVVDNTLMVCICVQYSLIMNSIAFESQENVCRYFVNGDDLLLAINPDYIHILSSFKSHFSNLGLDYDFSHTTNNKEDLWFMSHKGIKVNDMYIPKLEIERIVSILEWDRSEQPEHRMEAICASMIESWGYPELTHNIRKFYAWVLEQAPYNHLASEGKAPYISEIALKRLYTCEEGSADEILTYLEACANDHNDDIDCDEEVSHQSNLDAGKTNDEIKKEKEENERKERESREKKEKDKNKGVVKEPETTSDGTNGTVVPTSKDKDVDVGSSGSFIIPRIKSISDKLAMPKIKGKQILNLGFLLQYNPNQVDISNTRASASQFQTWYEAVKESYGVTDDEMGIILNGFMVWCIENGTSPNINGMWFMMQGDDQIEYPLQPIVENAKPTLRQIMAHFSNVAEAYIEKRNYEKPYMPRYGIQRNLTDMSLARFAFDFYEMTSRTPARAREAHIQMKAAALRNSNTRMFGLDGKVGNATEDTERHTADDVSRNTHGFAGARFY
ncbi:polyprotein [Thladiantha dubia mosaic virus]|uniref:Genome polyprotein n=1 Tax=Thladiantha dubia mosaic virus TaxID=2170423 RepID=A0A499Q6N2_9POTV|nr:polyprotein [Thladiantha dubia mosaic virus]AWA45285.1 polyprotein [Thladiantha dubia mosaic virus]